MDRRQPCHLAGPDTADPVSNQADRGVTLVSDVVEDGRKLYTNQHRRPTGRRGVDFGASSCLQQQSYTLARKFAARPAELDTTAALACRDAVDRPAVGAALLRTGLQGMNRS